MTWNQEQKEYAVWLTNQDNIAHRGEFDGDKEKQVAGMLGQVIVADAFAKQHGLTRPEPGKGHDGGKDFIVAGKRVDLKTLIRSVPPNAAYQHNIPAPQVNNPVLQTDVYLFGELDKTNKTYHLVGWLTAKEFKERAELRSRGEQKVRMDGSKLTFGVDTYEVDCNKLHYWAGFDRFEDELAQL